MKNEILNHLRFLTHSHRLPGSENEHRSANYIFTTLQNEYLITEKEEFETPSSAWTFFQFLFFTSLMISILYFFFTPPLKIFLLFIEIFLVYIFYKEFTFQHTFIYKLLKKYTSYNIKGKIPPLKKEKGKIIIVSHYDSATAGILFRPEFVKYLNLNLKISFYSYFFLILISLLNIFFSFLFLKILFFLLGIFYFISFLISLHTEYFAEPVEGANDNASSVSISLELAKYFKTHKLKNYEINFLFTGAEEAGCIGMYEHLKLNPNTYSQNDYFLILECTGIGNPLFLKSEGMLKKVYADKKLLNIAHKIKDNFPFPVREEELPVGYTEIEIVNNFKLRGLTIGSAPDNPDSVPNWHQKSDTLKNINPDTLLKVFEFTKTLIQELDK